MNYNKLSDNNKKKLIEQLYIDHKLSFGDIATRVGSYANKIRRDAIKFNIKIRNKSEAQKNALESGATQHPTKGKQRSDEVKNKIGLSVMNSWDNMSDKDLLDRQTKARENWINMDDEKKEHIIKTANQAVRLSSKTGSKLEKYLLAELIKNGYKVDFHKEHNLLNTKLQIDIFLPELNIAIEVDGPSHFLPVWGEESLKRNIKYDNKKNGLLLGKGCAIIRVKQTKDFSKSRAKIILEQILKCVKKIKDQFPDKDNRIIEIGDN